MAKADITGRLNLDSTGFQRGIQRSKNAVGRMQKSVVNASNALAKMGLAAASAAVLLLSRNAIQLGSYLSDVAESTGFATREFQVFRGALIDAGGKAENMEKAITLMQKAIVQGSEGMTTYTRAFERLGLNVDDLRKMKPEDQFQAIGKAIAGAKDQQGALTAAIEIFGQRNAPRLIEVFKRLDKDGYGKMAKDIEAAYGIMDAETQKALDRAADQIERFKNKATIKVGELIAGEADGAALKILGLSISKAGAQLGVGMVNGIMDSIAVARNAFGAFADYLYDKLSSTIGLIGTLLTITLAESINPLLEKVNKIPKINIDLIDTKKMYENLDRDLEKGAKTFADYVNERMSKQEKFDMKNRFGYDPGEFYDEAIDKQRELLQESRQVADNISEAFGTTGTRGGTGGTGAGGGTGGNKTTTTPVDDKIRGKIRTGKITTIGSGERESRFGAMPTMEERERAAGLYLAGNDPMSGRMPSGLGAGDKSGKDKNDNEQKESIKNIETIMTKLDGALSGE